LFAKIALPDADKCLGLMIGQYVELHIDNTKRPYNPISRIDEPGQVDFLITDLRKYNGPNSFTHKILSMKVYSKVYKG
jgi:NAD(P)H-flavin reductase